MIRLEAIFLLAFALLVACGREQKQVSKPGQGSAKDTSAAAEAAGAAGRSEAPQAGGLVGSKIEPFHVFDLEGKGSEIGGERDKVALVNLWATWCGPCRFEIPELIKIHETYASRGFEVVGVSVDAAGSEDSIREFSEETKINYPIVLDPDGVSASAFRSTVLPTSALLDRDGRILWAEIGIIRAGDPKLIAAIEKALQ